MSQLQIIVFSLTLLLLILLAAFFAFAETSLMAANRYRLRHKARLHKPYAIRLLQLLKRPDRLLGVILIGSTFANILSSSLATLIAFHYWGDNGALLAAVLLTFVVLIFAEIAPKTLAALYPDQIARWVVYPIQIILRIFYPMVWLANTITNSLLKLFRIDVAAHVVEPLTREELRSVVYDTSGKISRQYQNMLLTILDLNKLAVDDVMVPRHDIKGINFDQPWDQIADQLDDIRQDWIPVFRENVNQIIGVLYTRDVLGLLLNKKIMNKELLQQQIQKPYFVPQGTSLYVQLAYFQQSQDKIAFVVDEYGEIQGMLSLNDILEEIVGDFTSSFTSSKRVQLQADGSFLVEGATTLREFNRISEFDLPLRGPRTVNGLIVEFLEALPNIGTMILVSGYPIEIIQVKDNRVKLARVYPCLGAGSKAS